MKIDNFTKIVLTVIALNLTIISIKNLDIMPKAYANEPAKGLNLENNSIYGMVPLNEDGSINVKLQYGEVVDVRLRGIDEASSLRWEAIPVKVQN